MPEFAEHNNWLRETLGTLQSLQKSSVVDDAIRLQLQAGRVVCLQILKQNPASQMARDTIESINTILHIPIEPVLLDPTTNEVWQNMGNSIGIPPQKFLPQNENEHALQRSIESFEVEFLKYGNNTFLPTLQELANNSVPEQALQKALSFPFNVIKANAENPFKNVEVAKRIAEGMNIPWNTLLLNLPHPHYFAYGPFPQHLMGKATAGFAPLARMMVFEAKINNENKMDMLTVVHECLHLPQHALQRRNLKWYTQFYGVQQSRVIINDEYQAYGLEIEAMNIQLDNVLKLAVDAKRPVDRQMVMQALSARPSQQLMIEMLCQLAEQYYPNGNAATNMYPESYSTMVKNICFTDGYEVFENRAGRIVKIIQQIG